MNIAGNLRKVSIVINQKTLVASFEEGPVPLMSAIEVCGIARAQALHDFTHISPWGFYKKVNLTADQKVAINPEPELSLVTAQEFQIMPLVFMVPEKRLPVIRPNHHMIEGALELNSQRASHKEILLSVRKLPKANWK